MGLAFSPSVAGALHDGTEASRQQCQFGLGDIDALHGASMSVVLDFCVHSPDHQLALDFLRRTF